ncbi:hypothetical protein, partial [Escherichia coli]|uniref:hypothetical protein n=1 Tax=Escherichia coli TaxID=562 RepID=UPI001BFC27BB
NNRTTFATTVRIQNIQNAKNAKSLLEIQTHYLLQEKAEVGKILFPTQAKFQVFFNSSSSSHTHIL